MLNLNKSGKLQKIEGSLKSLLLELGELRAQHVTGKPDDVRQKLLRMSIDALTKLDRSSDDDDDAAMALSLEAANLSAEDRAANALAHRMGVSVPRELR